MRTHGISVDELEQFIRLRCCDSSCQLLGICSANGFLINVRIQLDILNDIELVFIVGGWNTALEKVLAKSGRATQ